MVCSHETDEMVNIVLQSTLEFDVMLSRGTRSEGRASLALFVVRFRFNDEATQVH